MYNDNWTEVAEHVGTKSQLQCIMHFLQMPIEDQFMDQMASGTTQNVLPEENEEKSDTDAERKDAIPFADANNPVMAQVYNSRQCAPNWKSLKMMSAWKMTSGQYERSA